MDSSASESRRSVTEESSQLSFTAPSSDSTLSDRQSKQTQTSYLDTLRTPGESLFKTGRWPEDIEIRLRGVPSTPSGVYTSYEVELKGSGIFIRPAHPQERVAPPKRGQWGSRIEFYLSLIGFAVGLGNVWRFPYLVYENGGGAFLIPYTIALFVIGMPVFYLELLIGQYSSLAPTKAYSNMAPVMVGLGWSMVFVSVVVSIYYNVILAWAFFYIASSFTKVLPWSSCMNEWNRKTCYSPLDNSSCEDKGYGQYSFYFNLNCHNASTATTLLNRSDLTSAASEYFDYFMYDYSHVSGFDLGTPQWKLVLALLVAWVLVAISLMWGLKSLGKVVYFTATFPYVIMIILLIRGVTLDGAADGLIFYLRPLPEKLLKFDVWLKAATQIFYSLGPCFGSLITMSSFNKFTDNCFQTAVVVSFINCLTSFFAGFAVFSTLGFIAKTLHKAVEDVVADGITLTFVTYPEAVAHMPLSQLWSILFFFMIVTLALDSEFAMVDVVITALSDQFPILIRFKWTLVQAICTVLFLLGLPMTLEGGDRLLKLIDGYASSYALLYLGVLEVLTVVYLYGHKRLVKDIRLMLGLPGRPIARVLGPSGWFWRVMWLGPTPAFIAVVLLSSLILYKAPTHRGYTFSPLAQASGFFLAFTPLALIIGWAIYRIVRNRMLEQTLLKLITPTSDWCPEEERIQREQGKTTSIDQNVRPPN